MVEVERKFLVNPAGIPLDVWDSIVDSVEVEQHYLSLSPEVRIRKSHNISESLTFYHMCVKSDLTQLARREIEIEITASDFICLVECSIGTVYKIRYRSEISCQFTGEANRLVIAEMDTFMNSLEELDMVEVEFPTEYLASIFKPPAWFGKEVTSDPRYRNKNLAVDGKPDLE